LTIFAIIIVESLKQAYTHTAYRSTIGDSNLYR